MIPSKPLAGAILCLILAACGDRESPIPVGSLDRATHARVWIRQRPSGASREAIVHDPALLATIRRTALASGDWAPTWHTAPVGDVEAALFRDSTFLATVSMGDGWVGAWHRSSNAEFRDMKPDDRRLMSVLEALPTASEL